MDRAGSPKQENNSNSVGKEQNGSMTVEGRKLHVVEELKGFIRLQDDGSISRTNREPTLGMLPMDSKIHGVKTRKVILDKETAIWAKIYEPEDDGENPNVVLVDFPGGGFCMLSPDSTVIHNMCVVWTAVLRVTIVSVGFRLAPEHRLPTAYNDCMTAVRWVLSMWESVPNVFLLGETSGGNIAHHVAVGLTCNDATALPPSSRKRIKGVVMLQPFFGSEVRTPSEEEAILHRDGNQRKTIYDMKISDTLWKMSLPVGANLDHVFANVTASLRLEKGKYAKLPRCMVVVGRREIGWERQMEYVHSLRDDCGAAVDIIVFEEEDHAFCCLNPQGPGSLLVLDHVRDFIRSSNKIVRHPSLSRL